MITLDKHIDILTTDYTKRIASFTIQFFEHNKKHKKYKTPYKPIATGVLITHNDRFFMITAGHVISDHEKGNIGIFETNTYYRIINEGQQIFYINPDDGKEHINFDIAVWELDTDTTAILAMYYDFLTTENILDEHNPSLTNNYLIVGYPSTRTTFNFFKSRLRPKIYKFLTKTVDDSIYKGLKIDPKANFIVEYNQRRIKKMGNNNIGRSIQLEGISGCGIWYIPNVITHAKVNNDYYLVSIVFRSDANKKYLISLKTNIIFKILKEKFNLV